MIRKYFHLIVLAFIVLAGIFIQTHSITTLTYPFTDEGVYLYASKLVAQGHVIYQDFFLIHLPLWIYINAAFMTIVKWNMDVFHFIYVVYVVTGVIPLYLLLYKTTKHTTVAALASMIYLSYPEMAQWDMHMFAMRQASLPLLGWGLYHLIASKKLKVSAVFLAFFAMSLVTNLFITLLIVMGWTMWTLIDGGYQKNRKTKISKILTLIIPLFVLIAIYYIMFLLIPNAYSDVFGYQLDNPLVSVAQRFLYLKGMFKLNWVIFATGILGWMVAPKNLRWLSASFILSSLLVVFATRSFYPHYLVILAMPLAIGSGLALDCLLKLRVPQWLIVAVVAMIVYLSAGKHLMNHLWQVRTDNFFLVVHALKSAPEPVFSFEPIYAMHAGKLLTFHGHVADARSFRVLGKYYSTEGYIELLRQSQTVLLDPYTRSVLPQLAYKYVRENFILSSSMGGVEIWIK